MLGELRMIKSVDKNYATIGDVLTYTIIINSTSEPSFDPNVGFIIPDINPKETVTITFEVTVN